MIEVTIDFWPLGLSALGYLQLIVPQVKYCYPLGQLFSRVMIFYHTMHPLYSSHLLNNTLDIFFLFLFKLMCFFTFLGSAVILPFLVFTSSFTLAECVRE